MYGRGASRMMALMALPDRHPRRSAQSKRCELSGAPAAHAGDSGVQCWVAIPDVTSPYKFWQVWSVQLVGQRVWRSTGSGARSSYCPRLAVYACCHSAAAGSAVAGSF